MSRNIILILSLLISFVPHSVLAADDTVDKTICKLAVGYQDVDEIQADLLAAAKREVINELFGEMIVASTAVENFVVTSDQIRTSSIGFVRVDGNAEFFNGKGFAEVCVTIQAYVTEEDRAKFIPEKLEKKYCDADEDMTTAQLIAYVKEEAVIQALVEYNPKLKGADQESLLQLVQKVSYLKSGFISDTQTYCAEFEGYVVPVEVIALLDTGDSPEVAGCNLEGQWQHKNDGQEPAIWTIVKVDSNTYSAQEIGLGNAAGTAQLLEERTFRIEWEAEEIYGYYEWMLDSTCQSGDGIVKILSSGDVLRSHVERIQEEAILSNTSEDPSYSLLEWNTDRTGKDYRSFFLDMNDPLLCQAACLNEAQCKAWTYVKPGLQGTNAKCWLKNGVPPPAQKDCCVSGVKE